QGLRVWCISLTTNPVSVTHDSSALLPRSAARASASSPSWSTRRERSARSCASRQAHGFVRPLWKARRARFTTTVTSEGSVARRPSPAVAGSLLSVAAVVLVVSELVVSAGAGSAERGCEAADRGGTVWTASSVIQIL